MVRTGSAAPIALAPTFAPSNVYSFNPLSLTEPTESTTPMRRAEGEAAAAGVDEGVADSLGVRSAADAGGSFEGPPPPQAITRMEIPARRLRRMGVTRITLDPRWRPRLAGSGIGDGVGSANGGVCPACTVPGIVSAARIPGKRVRRSHRWMCGDGRRSSVVWDTFGV